MTLINVLQLLIGIIHRIKLFFILNHIKLLDVTLRDGGYRNNFHFNPDVSKEIVHKLTKANIDYIEIGYRNSSQLSSDHGVTAYSDNEFIQHLKSAHPHCNLCIMIHPKNVNHEDFKEMKELGVKMIRVCVPINNLNQCIESVNYIKQLGFVTTANIIRASYIPREELEKAIETLNNDCLADVIYIADSNGNMIPSQVTEIISIIKDRTNKAIGFHAHNNLSLALSNTLSAINAGAEYIDASICGMGKGAGNLSLEILLSYFARTSIPFKYDLTEILRLADLVSKQINDSHLPLYHKDIMMGAMNLSMDFDKFTTEISSKAEICIYDLLYELGKNNITSINVSTIDNIISSLKQKHNLKEAV